MAKILVVDDDTALADMMSAWLRNSRYIVDVVYDGRDAGQMLGSFGYDLLILDWELPGADGIEICTAYRAAGGLSPILFLTGRGDLQSKVQGLDAGADDYLPKPFEFGELLARVNALLRRSPAAPVEVLSAGELRLELVSREATFAGEKVALTAKEFVVLEFLMRNPDQPFSSRNILETVWPSDADVSEDTVRSTIRHLRKKLMREGNTVPIETVGKGYKLSTNEVDKGDQVEQSGTRVEK